jgi:hypothetical protein
MLIDETTKNNVSTPIKLQQFHNNLIFCGGVLLVVELTEVTSQRWWIVRFYFKKYTMECLMALKLDNNNRKITKT